LEDQIGSSNTEDRIYKESCRSTRARTKRTKEREIQRLLHIGRIQYPVIHSIFCFTTFRASS